MKENNAKTGLRCRTIHTSDTTSRKCNEQSRMVKSIRNKHIVHSFICIFIALVILYRSKFLSTHVFINLKEKVSNYVTLELVWANERRNSQRKRINEDDINVEIESASQTEEENFFQKAFTEEETWPCADKMQKRRERIDEFCQQISFSDYFMNSTMKEHFRSKPKIDNIYINLSRKMGVCIPQKAGSQTWRYFFHKLDEKDSNITQNESRIQFQNNIPDDITEYYMAFQIRHPLERLLSSYRFVIERESMRSSTIDMNKEIFKLFPSDGNHIHKSAIYKTSGGMRIQEISISSKPETTAEDINWYYKIPSFKQFVQYVVDISASGTDFGVSKYKFVNHWLPYYISCNPCYQATRPSHVIHMETLKNDIGCYLDNNGSTGAPHGTRDLNLEESDFNNLLHVNQSPDGHSSEGEIRQKYLGQLSKPLMKKVYERYKEDFLLHGYKIESFFPYARVPEDSEEKEVL